MKKQEYDSLLDGIGFQVPESVEEFDKNAGSVGATLREGINNVTYRGTLADWRYYFLEGITEKDIESDKKLEPMYRTFSDAVKPVVGVQELTKIDRKTEPVLDKEGKPKVKDGVPVETYAENEVPYFKRVCAALVEAKKFATIDAAKESFRKLGQQVADYIRFNAAARPAQERGPAKLAQKYKDLALSFLTGKKNLAGLQVVFKRDLQKEFSPITTNGDGKPVAADGPENIEALGRMCKEWEATQDVFAKVK